jgi:hypothetical protein
MRRVTSVHAVEQWVAVRVMSLEDFYLSRWILGTNVAIELRVVDCATGEGKPGYLLCPHLSVPFTACAGLNRAEGEFPCALDGPWPSRPLLPHLFW